MGRGLTQGISLFLLMVSTLAIAVRDRQHTQSILEDETKDNPIQNANRMDNEVVARRLEDSREIAQLIGVTFDQNFIAKAFEFYEKRGLMVDNPRVTEEDIMSFVREVGGKEPTPEIMQKGEEFIRAKKAEFQDEQKDRPGDKDGSKDKDESSGGKDDRDRGRGRRFPFFRRDFGKGDSDPDSNQQSGGPSQIAGAPTIATIPLSLASQLATPPSNNGQDSGGVSPSGNSSPGFANVPFPVSVGAFNSPFENSPAPSRRAEVSSPPSESRAAVKETSRNEVKERPAVVTVQPKSEPPVVTNPIPIIVTVPARSKSTDPTSVPATIKSPSGVQEAPAVAVASPTNGYAASTANPDFGGSVTLPKAPNPDLVGGPASASVGSNISGSSDTSSGYAPGGWKFSGSGGTSGVVIRSGGSSSSSSNPRSLVDKFKEYFGFGSRGIATSGVAQVTGKFSGNKEEGKAGDPAVGRLPANASESSFLPDFGTEDFFNLGQNEDPIGTTLAVLAIVSGCIGIFFSLYRRRKFVK